MSGPQRWWRRLFATHETLVAQDLLEEVLDRGADAIANVTPGQRVHLHGVLSSVTLRPESSLKALQAELFDGSGSLDLVWLGRRRIAGVTPGRSIDVVGRVVRHHGRLVVFNPRYSLVAPGVSE